MSNLVIGVPREAAGAERRVALVPSIIETLVQDGFRILVERSAGQAAGYSDEAYRAVGAELAEDAAATYAGATLIARVAPPDGDELALMTPAHTLIAFLDPLGNVARAERLAATGATTFAFEFMPRTTRAQAMDALSSQATVAGYHGVLLAADRAPRLFPLLMTAAGTVKARSVLVLGAGVAGLQAIATARRLGAVVTAFDVRAAVKEQVESLGARFLAIDVAGEEQAGGYATGLDQEQHRLEQEALARACADADIVICTAQIPGARAPELITEAAVRSMRRGSVIVDLAASAGGNCACTVAGEEVDIEGVLVLGPSNPAAAIPGTASDLYAANVRAFVRLIAPGAELAPDWDDEIVAGALITRGGVVVAARVVERLAATGGAA
ncbi:MAG: NAD(P) transhydrogenase subunit alpha [Thermoleophilia bacterium]|nr:NAD(P) transhydrogenase subunit alpha [Thermoleophilia bacterium]